MALSQAMLQEAGLIADLLDHGDRALRWLGSRRDPAPDSVRRFVEWLHLEAGPFHSRRQLTYSSVWPGSAPVLTNRWIQSTLAQEHGRARELVRELLALLDGLPGSAGAVENDLSLYLTRLRWLLEVERRNLARDRTGRSA